eukprot:SM000152S01560  [mRNA]  locus=s152:361949:366017:+ [translate_table: standard]
MRRRRCARTARRRPPPHHRIREPCQAPPLASAACTESHPTQSLWTGRHRPSPAAVRRAPALLLRGRSVPDDPQADAAARLILASVVPGTPEAEAVKLHLLQLSLVARANCSSKEELKHVTKLVWPERQFPLFDLAACDEAVTTSAEASASFKRSVASILVSLLLEQQFGYLMHLLLAGTILEAHGAAEAFIVLIDNASAEGSKCTPEMEIMLQNLFKSFWEILLTWPKPAVAKSCTSRATEQNVQEGYTEPQADSLALESQNHDYSSSTVGSVAYSSAMKVEVLHILRQAMKKACKGAWRIMSSVSLGSLLRRAACEVFEDHKDEYSHRSAELLLAAVVRLTRTALRCCVKILGSGAETSLDAAGVEQVKIVQRRLVSDLQSSLPVLVKAIYGHKCEAHRWGLTTYLQHKSLMVMLDFTEACLDEPWLVLTCTSALFPLLPALLEPGEAPALGLTSPFATSYQMGASTRATPTEALQRRFWLLLAKQARLAISVHQSMQDNAVVWAILQQFSDHMYTLMKTMIDQQEGPRQVKPATALVLLFSEEDNLLLEMLLHCVEVYSRAQAMRPGSGTPTSILLMQKLREELDPSSLLLAFLSMLKYDHQVLVEFLISDSTAPLCLQVLVRCLGHLAEKLSMSPTSGAIEGTTLQVRGVRDPRSMAGGGLSHPPSLKLDRDDISLRQFSLPERPLLCIMLLRQSVRRLFKAGLFPYNPRPLLQRCAADHIEELDAKLKLC